MKDRSLRVACFMSIVLLFFSCSTTKFVPDGDYLLDKVEIVSDNKDYKPVDLKSYIRQQPNFKVFGLTKWQLFVYGWSGYNERKWINKQLRRIGEPPVILDTALVSQSVQQLRRFYINKGYIHADVSASIDTSRYKKAIVIYEIKTNEPYRIRNYSMQLSDPKIDSLAHLEAPRRSKLASAFRSSQEEYERKVKEGALFDRDVLNKERERISTLLRWNGYYAFNREYLNYIADSSFNQNVVDLEMMLRPYRKVLPNGKVENQPHRQYYINDVTIVTDYNPLGVGENANFLATDTVWGSNGVKVVYGRNGRSIRPGVLRRSTYIRPGQMFSEKDVEQTYSSFASLQALRNANIRFEEIEEGDTMKLNCYILTSPAKINTVGVEVEGTNSAGDFGFASSLSYQHRNLFKGSEVFTAKVRGAYEALSGNNTSDFSNYWEVGVEGSLLFPRFLFPFLSPDFKRKIKASTEAKISYNLQDRPEYTRAILSGGWSYIWQDRGNTFARHTFKLFDLNYVYLPYRNEEFINSLPDYMVLYNYTSHFIMGSGYTYSFSNSSSQNQQRNTHSLRASIEIAGNLLNAISHLTGSDKNEDGYYELFGTEYAQYVKFDFDFSKQLVLDDRNNRLAFHVGVGVGLAYGNSDYLPFERAYFSGGANSVRGWSVRDLGPGSMEVTDTTSYALQSGDIRLDLNVEYRTKLFWKFEMAAYVDAGNVWTRNVSDEDGEDGNFDFSRFYKEIAVSYGVGLRLDFDFFLLRLDTGFKAYNPQKRGSDRWAITNPNFKDNFALHFAVGYPF